MQRKTTTKRPVCIGRHQMESRRDSTRRAGSTTRSSKRAVVAMSGGVDSSVSALLLKKQGFDVVGVFIRSYNIDGCQTWDVEDTRRVAEKIGIPFYVWDFEDEYKRKVVEYMIDGYRRGLTPNPDVMCNREIKFGAFYRKARAMGADFVATGHYARIRRREGVSHLYAAKDKNKDQTYFLWTLTPNELDHVLFPIGEYEKPAVREMARRAGLPTADKKDSQGICFLGKVAIADFLKRYIPEKRGAVLTVGGEPIGEHDGAYFYTIGQRHGLNLQTKNRMLSVYGKTETKPHYIAEKDVRTNTVVVAEGENNPALFRKEVLLTKINLVGPLSLETVYARVRYRQILAKARLQLLSAAEAKLIFEKPQKFVAPGQSAVFYSKTGRVRGGGIIS